MKVSLIGIAVLIAFQEFAQAESIVSRNCAGQKVGSIPKAFTNFSTESLRRSDAISYVKAMDELITNGPFKHLLDCRDKLKSDSLFSYRLRFLGENESQTMTVRRSLPDGGGMMVQVAIELSINLKSSPQKVFFTYIHELTHVCQAYQWADLQTKYDFVKSLKQISLTSAGGDPYAHYAYVNPKCPTQPKLQPKPSYSEIKADYYRHRKLGEVEAFYNMTKAYQHYSGIDPLFCHGTKDDGNSNMYEGYLDMEKMIDQGYFAQDIIVKYHEEDGNKEETANALFNLKAPQVLYPDKVYRPTLNTAMRNLIEKKGLPIEEPAEMIR